MCGVYGEQMQALMDLENTAANDYTNGPTVEPLLAAQLPSSGLHFAGHGPVPVKSERGTTMLSQEQLLSGGAPMNAGFHGTMPTHPPPGMMHRHSGSNVMSHAHEAAPSHFRGVTRNGNAWQADVIHGGRWVWRQLYETEIDAAVGYDNAVRRLMPQDAESLCNFHAGAAPTCASDLTQGMPSQMDMPRGPPLMVPDGAHPGVWDAQDMRSGVPSGGMLPHQRGMVKSSSVSTLMAATTLSENAALAHSHSGQFGTWHPNTHGMGMNAPMPAGHDVSAASLLLGAEPLSARSLHQQGSYDGSIGPDLGEAGTTGADAASARSAATQHARVSDSGRAPRRISSAHDLASTSQGGISKTAGKGATRASNRRAHSRYAKDKVKAEEQERSAEASRGATAAAAAAAAQPADAKSSREQKLEQMRALQRGQERLHEQMRMHQAQHEEQQKRAMLREAERANAETAAPLPQHTQAPMPSQQRMPPTSMPNSSGSPASFGGAARNRGDLLSEDGSQHSGSRSTPGAVRSRAAAMASTAEHSSGGKMPRRIPSEPHSLAAMGVAGMGGRHQPATTRAPAGMRKVKSTHNFGQFCQQQQPPTSAPVMASHHMAMPMPGHVALRASPSMPSFPTMTRATFSRDQSHSHEHGGALPHITEEYEESGLRLQEPLSSMFLDDPDAGGDDLMSLMKELTDPTEKGFDLDLAMPSESKAGGSAQDAAGSGNGAAGAVAASVAAPTASDGTPSFLQLDPGLAPLDEDELNSAFLGAS